MLNRIYRIMEKTIDEDYLPCFNIENRELTAYNLSDARQLKAEFEIDYDNPLVIIEETQIIIE